MSRGQEKRIFHRLRKHQEKNPPSKGAQGDDPLEQVMTNICETGVFIADLLNIDDLLTMVHTAMSLATMYDHLFEKFNPETSNPVEYENHYHRVDRIWQELQETREPGEGNDEILEDWERVHKKACEVYQQIKPL